MHSFNFECSKQNGRYVSFPYIHIHHLEHTHTHTNAQVPEGILLKINKMALFPKSTTLRAKYVNNSRWGYILHDTTANNIGSTAQIIRNLKNEEGLFYRFKPTPFYTGLNSPKNQCLLL